MTLPDWLTDFLEPAWEGIKELAEQSNDKYDGLYLVCAYIAYNQVCEECGRKFASDGEAVEEYFEDVLENLFLRNYPVNEVSKIEIQSLDGTTEEFDGDYLTILQRNTYKVLLDMSSSSVFLSGATGEMIPLLKLTYKYGAAVISDLPAIEAAVITQGLAIWKRKDYVGVTNTEQTSFASPEVGDIPLLDSVKNDLLRGWKFYSV